MGTVWILALSLFVIAQSSPLPNKLKYDQRQEGKWNVRADLENFLILVIPTSRSGPSNNNASLFDFLSKTIAFPIKHNRRNHVVDETNEKSLNTEQFIESKTAPYHVDISRTRSQLAKLHPEINIKDDVIQSPSVALSKIQDQFRSARALVVKVPVENQNVLMYNKKETNEEFKKGDGAKPNITVKFEDLSPELKSAYAHIIADVIKVGLIEYFKKVAEHFDEKRKDAEDIEEPLKVPKEETNKKKLLEKSKKKRDFVPSDEVEVVEPNVKEDQNQELPSDSKADTLLLLDGQNESASVAKKGLLQ